MDIDREVKMWIMVGGCRMPYYAKPMTGHSIEEICAILTKANVKDMEIISGIVVVGDEEDPPPEVEKISYVEICVDHRFDNEY